MQILPSDPVAFGMVRPGSDNPSIESETLVRLLWRNEVADALTDLGCEPAPSAGRFSMWKSLLRMVDEDALLKIVRNALLHRLPVQASAMKPLQARA
jgi:hypothetical protein